MRVLRNAIVVLESKHRRRAIELVRGIRTEHGGLLTSLQAVLQSVRDVWECRWLTYYPSQVVDTGVGNVFLSDLEGEALDAARHRFSEQLWDSLRRLRTLLSSAATEKRLQTKYLDVSEDMRRHDENCRAAFASLTELLPIGESSRIWTAATWLEFSECSVPSTNERCRAFEGLLLLAGEECEEASVQQSVQERISAWYEELEANIEWSMSAPVFPQLRTTAEQGRVQYRNGAGGLRMADAAKERVGSAAMPADDAPWKNPLLRYWAKIRRGAIAEATANVNVLVIPHVLGDFLDFVRALVLLGFKPHQLFVVGVPYSTKDYVVNELRRWGVNVEAPKAYPFDDTVSACLRRVGSSFCVVEDGGYAVPLLHGDLAQLASGRIGAVEQTANGIWRSREAIEKAGGAAFPLVDVAESRSKGAIEGRLVGDAIVHNVRALLLRSGIGLRGKRVLVVGYGTVGAQVARTLRASGAQGPIIYDTDTIKIAEGEKEGYETAGSLADGCERASIIIGCSGRPAIGRDELLRLRSGTVIVNASSKRQELDYAELEALFSKGESIEGVGSMWHTSDKRSNILLLADGYPVNFFDAESIPDEEIQFVPTLMLESLAERVNLFETPACRN